MTDSFRAVQGRRLVSRSSAETMGAVTHLLVDPTGRTVAGLVVGKGRKAGIVDWGQVFTFGPDAVIVADDQAVRPPADDRERDAADGRLELLGKRALDDLGNEVGTVDDARFDPASGALSDLMVAGKQVDIANLRGVGRYAAVLHLGERDDRDGAAS